MEDSVLSSCEEEVRAERSSIRTTRTVAKVNTQLPVLDDVDIEEEDLSYVDHRSRTEKNTIQHLAKSHPLRESVELHPMRDFLQRFPHLALHQNRDPKCGKSKHYLNAMKRTKKRSKRLEYDTTRDRPLALKLKERMQRANIEMPSSVTDLYFDRISDNELFQSQLRSLHPTYGHFEMTTDKLVCGDISTEMMNKQLQRPLAVVPCYTAVHESRLLKEAGSFYVQELNKIVNFPMCSNERSCVASLYWNKIRNLERPIVLMSSMDEDQYRLLLQSEEDANFHDDEPAYEIPRAPCVLCYRFTTSAMLLEHRAAMMLSYTSPFQQAQLDPERGEYDLQQQPIQAYHNLSDKENGYQSEYMIKCNTQDCVAYPVVMDNLSMLRANKEPMMPGYRYFIDQSDIVYGSLYDIVDAIPGERVQLFLSRNRSNHTNKESFVYQQRNKIVSESIACSFLDLLRGYPYVWKDVTSQRMDMIQLEQCMNDSSLPPMVSLACAHVLDSFRYAPEKKRFVTWSDGHWPAISSVYTLDPTLSMNATNLAWFTPLAGVSSPILHLMTKCCVMARCQTRTFSAVLRKQLVQRNLVKEKTKKRQTISIYNAYVFNVCKQVMLCILLGNYPQARVTTRPCEMARAKLYDIFTESVYDRWILSLMQHCSTLLAFAMRSFFVFIADSMPSLSTHLNQGIQIEQYSSITENAVSVARVLFNRCILDPRSSLYTALDLLPRVPCKTQHLWFCGRRDCQMPCTCKLTTASGSILVNQESEFHEIDCENDRVAGWHWNEMPFHVTLNQELNAFDGQMKKLSFRRKQSQFSDLLRSMRRDFPLIPLVKAYEHFTIKDESQQSFEADDGLDEFGELSINEQPDEKTEEKADEAEDSLSIEYTFAANIPSRFIGADHLHAMRMVIQSCGPVGFDSPVQRVLDFLPHFKIPMKHVLYVKKLFYCFYHQLRPTESLKKAIWILRVQQPYLYNLLQIISELIQQCQRRLRIATLAVHVAKAQIQVIRDVHTPGNTDDWLLQSQIAFVFCRVCMHIYSPLKDFNSVYKNQYLFGLRDASVSYLTDRCYCTRQKVNHRGRCGEDELVRIPMIGRMLFFQLKRIMICPQKGCGALMAFDNHNEQYMLWNEYGPACKDCTEALKPKPTECMRLNRYYRDPNLSLHCLHCPDEDSKIANPTSAHLYGDAYLCKEHHSRQLAKSCIAAIKSIPSTFTQRRNDVIHDMLRRFDPRPIIAEFQRLYKLKVEQLLRDIRDTEKTLPLAHFRAELDQLGLQRQLIGTMPHLSLVTNETVAFKTNRLSLKERIAMEEEYNQAKAKFDAFHAALFAMKDAHQETTESSEPVVAPRPRKRKNRRATMINRAMKKYKSTRYTR